MGWSSLCLPPARTHFCTSATRGGSYGTGSSPRKYGTNGIIPEFTNIGAVGWCGIKPADGTILCCRCAKKSRNFCRSSSDFIEPVRLVGRPVRSVGRSNPSTPCERPAAEQDQNDADREA